MVESSEIILSRQNRALVELGKLNDRKTREETHTFRFDGIKLFGEAVQNGLEICTVFLRQSDAARIKKQITESFGGSAFDGEGRILTVSDDLFDRISEEKSPDGVICTAKYIDKLQKNITIYNSAEIFSMQNERIVFVESVRDPSNVGAIIRSAAALGVDRLILSADCADIYHPKTVRASMGTLFNQKIDRVQNLPETVKAFCQSGRRVFAAALDPKAKKLGSFAAQNGDCVVIGNEGHGLTRETVDACSDTVFIPMSGRAESFNAAVAASILIWEFSKGNS